MISLEDFPMADLWRLLEVKQRADKEKTLWNRVSLVMLPRRQSLAGVSELGARFITLGSHKTRSRRRRWGESQ